jgi:predicted Zn-dependent protease
MGPSRLGANIASRALEFFLALTILILFHGISPAQNKAVNESEAGPRTTAAYHEESIRDISDVGNRDVGCAHGLGSRYNLKAQIQVGHSDAQQVEARSKLITDRVITEYVNRIGQNLVRNSDARVAVTFKIIDAEDVNAFSLPGGFIFVDSGLILAADDEGQLAAVMAHEIAHVAACHPAQEMAAKELTKVASVPRIFRLTARHLDINTVYLPPVRSFESEADFLAVQYLYKTGYDPQALSSFFEKIKRLRKQKPGSRGEGFDADAQLSERIKRTQQEISTLLPPASQYKVDTSDFQEIKARLAEMKLGIRHDGDRPGARNAPPSTISCLNNETACHFLGRDAGGTRPATR